MSQQSPRRLAALASLTAAALAACSGTAEPVHQAAQQQGVSIDLQPTSASVPTRGARQFVAAVTGTADTVVTWSIEQGAVGGTITQAGAYTAGTTPGTYSVVVTSHADSTKSVTATVTVSAPVAASPTISPGTSSSASAITATITCSTSGTLPYRTTNGSAPTTASPQSGTATFSASGTLRAICAGAGYTTSPEASATYTITSGTGGALMPADTVTTWNPGIPGGIPTTADLYTTLSSPGTGNAAALINNALAAASAQYRSSGRLQVVKLNPGNYFVTSRIAMTDDGVILRGSGWQQTRIVGRTGEWVVVIGDQTTFASTAIAVTADGVKGSSQISVASASSIAVGDILQIDQVDGPAAPIGAGSDDGVHYLNGYVYFGDGIYFKPTVSTTPGYDSNGPYTIGVPWQDNHGTWLQTANWNAQNAGPFRSILQRVRVIAKSGNTLTLAEPLHVDFTTARQARAFVAIPLNTQGSGLGTRWCGLEDFSIAGGDQGRGHIALSNVAYGWVKGVELDGEYVSGDSLHPGLNGQALFLAGCYRCEARNNYAHHSTVIVYGGGSYGISLSAASSETLIEDNISTYFDKPVVIGVSGGGNVVAYNYVDNAIIEGTDWEENALDDCHEAGSHMDLIEGNWTPNIGPDTTHGSSHWMTHFRNYASGRNTGTWKSTLAASNLRAFAADAYSGWNNVVGNVLIAANVGTPVYEITGTPTGNPNGLDSSSGFVYRFGGGGDGGVGGIWDNGYAKSQTYRHGNWDNITSSVVWDASNSNHTLPDSLYLGTKPAFFGSNPWPWVNPLGATAADRVKVLPAKARYDAGTPIN